jgi:hypothetical protein
MSTRPQIRLHLFFATGNDRALFQRMAVPDGEARALDDTEGGCLCRRHGADRELIRDFADMAFEPIRAPCDWRDAIAEDAPRPPLDGAPA